MLLQFEFFIPQTVASMSRNKKKHTHKTTAWKLDIMREADKNDWSAQWYLTHCNITQPNKSALLRDNTWSYDDDEMNNVHNTVGSEM
jgi:hypothetical protein